jgi:hypothetical protein
MIQKSFTMTLISLFMSAFAGASETRSLLTGAIHIADSAIKSVALFPAGDEPQYCRIRKVFVQATGVGSEAMAEVIVGGDIKGTIHVPGQDPNYVVTVEARGSSIEIRGIKGNMRVEQIHAVLEDCSGEAPHLGERHSYRWIRGEASKLSSEALRDFDVIEKFASAEDQKAHVLPLKKLAAKAYASSLARGDLSAKVQKELRKLYDGLRAEEAFLEKLYEIDDLFEVLVDLKRIEGRLEDILGLPLQP